MCVHLNSLPDDCLLPIFDQMPLLDLLRLDQVCLRWASLFPSACARRRTLCTNTPLNNNYGVSFDGRQPYFDLAPLERENSLTFPFLMPDSYFGGGTEWDLTEMARFHRAHLAGQLDTYLTDLLPNVDTLVVIHTECDEDELRSVIKLVGSWSLKILKLCLRTREIDWSYLDTDHHPVRYLLHSISQQSSLQQLNLNIDGDGIGLVTFPLNSYSFIAQLKVVKLYLGVYGQGTLIWDILHRFDSTKLRKICLENEDIRMKDALNPKFEFTTKVNSVRKFCGYLRFETIEKFVNFCCRFASLTSLRMDWSPNITFTQLVINLAGLAQLTYLELNINFEEHPENAFVLVERIECNEDKEEPRRISLPHVKILELNFVKRSHHHFESLSPLIFPSVEVITLWNSHGPCTTCRPDGNDSEMINRCHRLLIDSLKAKFSNSVVRIAL